MLAVLISVLYPIYLSKHRLFAQEVLTLIIDELTLLGLLQAVYFIQKVNPQSQSSYEIMAFDKNIPTQNDF